MRKLGYVLVAGLALGGCTKGGGGGSSGSGPFAAFDLPALEKKWQGAWVVGGSMIGQSEAWEVKGDKVTVFDGKDEKTMDFAVVSPCTATVTTKSGGGSSSTTTKFTFNGDTLLAGLGQAGAKKGNTAVVCATFETYILDDKGCTEWKQSMFDRNKWESKPGTCKWDTVDGKQAFSYTDTFKSARSVPVLGDALADQQMAGNVAKKFPDFAAAKAALKK